MNGVLEKIANVLFGSPELGPDEERAQAAEVERRVTEKMERLRAEARGWRHQSST